LVEILKKFVKDKNNISDELMKTILRKTFVEVDLKMAELEVKGDIYIVFYLYLNRFWSNCGSGCNKKRRKHENHIFSKLWRCSCSPCVYLFFFLSFSFSF
jgi:hypothetical protein